MRKVVVPFTHEGWSVAADRLNNAEACSIAAERMVVVRETIAMSPQKRGAAGPRWRDVTMTVTNVNHGVQNVRIHGRSGSMTDWLTITMVFPPAVGAERPELGRGLALAMIDAAVHGIHRVLAGATIDDQREEDVHAGLKALKPSTLAEGCMFYHPSPWMPLGGYRMHHGNPDLELDERQRAATTDALPRRYRCFAHHSGDEGAVGVRLSPVSVRGGAAFDPMLSMRALSRLPEAFRKAFA